MDVIPYTVHISRVIYDSMLNHFNYLIIHVFFGIHIHICICMYICTHIYIFTYVYVCVCVSILV